MKNQEKVIKFTIFSIVFVAILGTLLHFSFEWSNDNLLVGAFSAVNESTWEHLKLLFFPMLITTILGYFYIGKDLSVFLCARVFGIISAILFTIIFFYTYSGILGTNISFLNIATFYIAVITGEYISYKVMLSNLACNNSRAIISLVLLFFCFIFFTYFPPKIGLFKVPLINGYGIIPKD
jgi:hypothetical protein